MPRISPSQLLHASHLNPLLRPLLCVTRDIQSAKNELKWIEEHVRAHNHKNSTTASSAVKDLVSQRARGVPIQYLLESEYFGDLEIQCRRGVLIPRQDTASIVTYLANVIRKHYVKGPGLRILDVCTGSGCIAVLMHYLLRQHNDSNGVEVLGVDSSARAIRLARENLSKYLKDYNLSRKTVKDIRFIQGDLFEEITVSNSSTNEKNVTAWTFDTGYKCDVIVSNPPYISTRDLYRTTSRSVRMFEPRSALVPKFLNDNTMLEQIFDSTEADLFYGPLCEMAKKRCANLVLFEIGDISQASRVAKLTKSYLGEDWNVEIWRDHPDMIDQTTIDETMTFSQGYRAKITGLGNARGVFAWQKASLKTYPE